MPERPTMTEKGILASRSFAATNCIEQGRAGSGLREGPGERVTGKQGRACNRLEGEYVARVTALEGWNEHRTRGAPGPPLPAV